MTRAIITVDLGWGDSGKGTIVDALVRKFRSGLVVRFNGGSQCGHNVVLDNGVHHEFAQFGSGSFANAATLLSKHVIVNPLDMLLEAEVLDEKLGYNPVNLMYIDERALVTTPYHVALNRVRELSRSKRNGSCGKGIRETVVYAQEYPDSAIYISDLKDLNTLYTKLKQVQLNTNQLAESLYIKSNSPESLLPEYVTSFEVFKYRPWRLAEQLKFAGQHFNICTPNQVRSHILEHPTIIFEAAQGILLDQHHGFRPHITKSTCTTQNAKEILNEAGFQGDVTELGITRTYMTKHGAGPFPTEDAELTKQFQDAHNHYNDWQQDFRVGYLDVPALKYAVEVNGGLDGLAVTHVDKLPLMKISKVGLGYQRPDFSTFELHKQDGSREQQENLTKELSEVKCNNAYIQSERVPAFLSSALGVPVLLTSDGPKSREKKFYGKLNTNLWS